ncbi:MAG: hypothetical protein ABSC07_04325 [Terriglobales bacterium]|jgi:hypothetical protein
MVQRRDGAGFAVETLLSVGIVRKMTGQDLNGDGAIEASVLGAVYLAHTAGADRRLHFIRP